MLKNLLKCSPKEAPIWTQLKYTGLDDIVNEIILASRAYHLKSSSQQYIFDLFKTPDQKHQSQILVQKVLKHYVSLVKDLEADITPDASWTLQRQLETREIVRIALERF